MTDHQKGLVLTFIGGLVLSFDIPILRLGQGEVWSVLLMRSLTTLLLTIGIWMVIRMRTGRRHVLVPGRDGLIVGALYGVGTVAFMISVFNTSTANVAFILAFNPMFGALLSWIFLKERPAAITFAAMLAMLFGMMLIVHDGLETGHAFGDLMALCSAFTSAAAITLSRANGGNFGFAPLASTFLPALVGAWFVGQSGFFLAAPEWIIFNGMVITPIAFWCLATGPRYLSAPEVGMFYLLETILAPLWVWLLFADQPSGQVMIGGAIMLVALISHSVLMLRHPRPA